MTERRLQPHAQIVNRLRRICASLTDSVEHEAWTGTSWRVHDTTFLHTLQITDGWPPAYARAFDTSGPTTVVTFQVDEDDYEALRTVGHPYYHPVWRPWLVGVTIDSDTDWISLAERIEDSHRWCRERPGAPGRHH